jgi:hypothetical protein
MDQLVCAANKFRMTPSFFNSIQGGARRDMCALLIGSLLWRSRGGAQFPMHNARSAVYCRVILDGKLSIQYLEVP